MLELAHREHGRLPWARLFAEAIHLSKDGFPISERLARQIAGDRHLAKFPATRAYFFDGDQPKAAGTILKNPALAKTLEAIAQHGADALHEKLGGLTALQQAAERGHDAAVALLIAAGADLDVTDGTGRTPLYAAAYCNRVDAQH